MVNLGWILREEHDRDEAEVKFKAGVRASRLQGDVAGLAYSALGLACLASDLAAWQRAARLFGVADALLESIGHRWQHPESKYRDTSIDSVVQEIGTASFEAEHLAGERLSLEAAIEYCLTPAPQPS